MKVLVAGGAGFLGSHLCDALYQRGDEVIAVDDCSTGRFRNIEHLVGLERFHWIQRDLITSPFSVGPDRAPIAMLRNVDVIVNMASPASPADFRTRGRQILQCGSAVTLNLLEVAAKVGARYVHASTSEVYGDPEQHPQDETYRGNVALSGPRAVYDEAKRFGEAAVNWYGEAGVDVGIIRVFNTYGPRMRPDDGRVLTNFIRAAIAGERLTVYGSGRQTRSFCWVGDQIEAWLRMIDSPLVAGPINVGSADEIRIDDLAELVIDLCGSTSSTLYTPHHELCLNDPFRRRPNTLLARELLGWAPTVPLDLGLAAMISWMRDGTMTLTIPEDHDARQAEGAQP